VHDRVLRRQRITYEAIDHEGSVANPRLSLT
jgi:hypothetical protein